MRAHRGRRMTIRRVILVSALVLLVTDALAYPDGFGRFGRINEDGLLTLSVSPTGFSTPPTERSISARFGNGTGTAEVLTINATEKVLRIHGGGSGEPTEIRYTLLYPGFSARFGTTMEIHFSGASITVEEPSSAEGRTQHWLLIRPTGQSAMPLAIAFRPGLEPEDWNFSASVLTVSDPSGLGEVRFITPRGIDDFTGNPSPAQLDTLHRDAEAWANREIPTLISHTHQIEPGGEWVRFVDEFQVASGEAQAPISPVLAFAIANGYPATIQQELITTDCITLWGPFAHVEGGSVTYSLPLPPMEERGYVRSSAHDPARLALCNDLVGHLGGAWASNAVDLSYAGMTNAQMAWPHLDAIHRLLVIDAWAEHLELGFDMPPYGPDSRKTPWFERTEPFTGEEYLWTYFIDGPGDHLCDIEWGNGLPMYGLWKYAQWTGDWARVESEWDAVRRIHRYFELGHDWAWMTVVNADIGYSTGTGDPLNAALGGSIAGLGMARHMGDTQAEEMFAAEVARMCVPAVARFWFTDFARQEGLIDSSDMALGFNEIEGYTRSSLGRSSPWWITTLISGDGVLPEVIDVFMAFGRNALETYEERFVTAYPDWCDGHHVYPFPVSYAGNSVYVIFPHIYLRSLLGESIEQLWGCVWSTERNRNSAWIGPNAISELLARETPLTLTRWYPAAYLDGLWDPETGSLSLQFHLMDLTNWTLRARLHGGDSPSRIFVNGAETPFAMSGGEIIIDARMAGDVTVEMEFPTAPPPTGIMIGNTDVEISAIGAIDSPIDSAN